MLALIPARAGSKGIPHKNFRRLGGVPLWQRAAFCAEEAGISDVYVSSDCMLQPGIRWLHAPAPLHTDICPMIDVVKDALKRVPGPGDQIVVLLQPSQPLRQVKHVREAIDMLSRDPDASSVVSVVEAESPDRLMRLVDGRLEEWDSERASERRQDAELAYKRDGTVYAFRRQTVERYGNIYGYDCRPLIIPPGETCDLDTEEQWDELQKRWHD